MARRRGQRKGHLTRRGPSWLLEWREYELDSAGKLVPDRKSRVIAPAEGPGALSKREAERIARDEVLSSLDQRNLHPSSLMTVEEFVRSRFEPQVIWKRKPAGQKHYGYILRKLLHTCPRCGKLLRTCPIPEGRKVADDTYCSCGTAQSLMGARRLCDVSVDDVELIMAHLHRKGYSGQTVLHFRNVIGAIFRHAKKLRLYADENPAHDVELPEVRHEKRPTYSWEQCGRAIEHLTAPYREMALLSVATSMNVAEMCGVRRKHANLTDQVVVVEGEVMAPFSIAVRENFYEGKRGSLKAGSRKRNVPITRELAAALVDLTAQSKHQGPEVPLFCSRNGTPIDAHNASNRHLRPLSVKLGFDITWHAFRRAHSTFAGMIEGVQIEDRVATMGHRDAQMTLYYSVEDVERRRAVPQKIMERLMPANVVPIRKGA